jgi:hypothetical protein
MDIKLRQRLDDAERAFRGPLKVWAWIAVAIVGTICLGIVLFEQSVPTAFFRIAQIVLIGASTAAFTRFMASMGMFKDALADLMQEDAWIDRRNDVEKLWGRITRRIFLPGFREDAPHAGPLLDALNQTMGQLIKPEKRADYFAKDMRRRIEISWFDEAGRIVEIVDYLESDIVPFRPDKGCSYEMEFTPTTGELIEDYYIAIRDLCIDNEPKDPDSYRAEIVNGVTKYSVKMEGKDRHFFSRTMIYRQNVDADPIFYVAAGRVVWGMNAIITLSARGLRLNYEDIGIERAFRDVPHSATVTERDTRAALLPDHGFIIVMASG